jgi:single-strand DNA-binding protein
MSLPKIIGVFRLTRDAELKYSNDGKPILKMGLASSEKFGDRETQCFIDATVFGKPAEIINQFAGEKGTQIFLTGKLQTETWADKETGANRSKHSMIVESFDFVGGKKDDTRSGKNQGSDYAHGERRNMQEPSVGGGEYVDGNGFRQSSIPEIDIEDSVIPF